MTAQQAYLVLSIAGWVAEAGLIWWLYRLLLREREIGDQKLAKDKALFDSLGEGIVVTNKEGNVELINRRAEILVGWKNEEVVGRKWYEVAPLVDENGVEVSPERRATQIVLRTGEPRASALYYYRRRDGTKFAVGTTAAPVILNGKTIGVIAVFRDITREKEVERAKSEFASLASHQLRTPLSAIRWFSEMLLAGDAGELTSEQREYMESIAQSNTRMVDMVNSLLNISRIESGRIMIDPKPTDLGKLVAEVVAGLEVSIKEKGINLAVSVFPDLQEINIDPRLISQVYLNLLTNALKYTPKKGKIMVVISKKQDEIVSQVTDTGYGIPRSEQYRMFEKFFRGSNVVKLEADGTGLGLYLAKAIVESSGGRMWFESKENSGTSFWFSLPLSGTPAREGEVALS